MKQYFSKLLLFGEHIIIKGAQALAIPFTHFHGHWEYAENNWPTYQMNLFAFSEYLAKNKNENNLLQNLEVDAFREALDRGLYFQSNIPTGYGVGSSGALCAAIYDRFGSRDIPEELTDLPTLKKTLALMEGFFHGASSGIDPLVCYLHQPLLIENKVKVKVVAPKKTLQKYNLFLLDTGITRQTAPYVQFFLKEYETTAFAARCESELIPASEAAIDAYLQAHEALLFEKMHEIGHFHFKYFPEMIPNAFRKIWLDSLTGNDYKFKICGAGGGGFLLGITRDFAATQKAIPDYPLILI